MSDLDKLIERIRANGDEVWIAGPASERAVAALEQAVGVPLPPSYRHFLLRYGGMRILESVISGIVGDQPLAAQPGQLYADTQRYRREAELPSHLLVVQPDEDTPYCLDTRRTTADGEFPLVSYDLQTQEVERLAASFGAWFAEWLELEADDEA